MCFYINKNKKQKERGTGFDFVIIILDMILYLILNSLCFCFVCFAPLCGTVCGGGTVFCFILVDNSITPSSRTQNSVISVKCELV